MGSASACFDFLTFVDPIVWVRGGLRRRRETLALKIGRGSLLPFAL